jgi:hypothetical protein
MGRIVNIALVGVLWAIFVDPTRVMNLALRARIP